MSRNFNYTLTLVLSALCMAVTACAQSLSPEKTDNLKINWQLGPKKVSLGDQAELNLPKGYIFADSENTRRFLTKTHNIPSGQEVGTIASSTGRWFAVFDFDPVGYVKDDEKDKLDGDAILKSLRAGTEEENKEREKRGWDTYTIPGWIDPPHYDGSTHQLTWSLLIKSKSGESANYRTRLLGRHGVMSVELVVNPQQLYTTLPEFQRVAASGNFSFTPDNKYSAFMKGDKVAEYGLTALIVGGAAAAAVKFGLFKYLIKFAVIGWKFIVIGLGAVVAFLKKLFGGRKDAEQTSTSG